MNDNIYNTFLAGWCAEAVGARLEFMKKKFTDEEVFEALHMVGEASSSINPGQITDDSEMEMALLSALIEGQKEEYFPLEIIAKKYIEWYKSKPFDIGQTTTFALLDADNASDILSNSYEYNMDSESNGSLMRCIPLAVFGINKEDDVIMKIAELESELTHPNKIVGEVTGLYCIIIAHLLRSKIKKCELNIDHLLNVIANRITNDTILNWFEIGCKLTNINNYDSITNEGHVKHAFIFVIYFLNNINKYTYVQAISEVIKCGGDTDTNAKIVGNLFGAYYDDCVPSYLADIILNFDCTKADHKFYIRPYNCSVKYAIELLKFLPILK